MEKFSTACPRNCYSTCSFYVYVENNQVVHIDPHPDNKATPEGICLKGLSYVERANAEDRIYYPMIKGRHSGDFIRITWEDAYNELTKRLLKYKNEFGPQSVLFYAASGMSGLLNSFSQRFWKIYGGATTTYGNLCWPAGLEATRLTLGENKHNAPWDIAHAKLIIMWGKNPVETNVQQMIPVEKALEKGAKLIVIDPRRTPSSEKAELLLQPKPGTDAALALAMANTIIRNNQIDRNFIDKYVLGFEQFSVHVKKYTPEFAERITGIPADYIRKLSAYIGTIKPMTIAPGYGMQRFTNGGQTIRSILALQVITGNIGKAGACWHYANLQSYVFDQIKEPLSYYPPEQPDGIFRRSISMAKLGVDMMAQKKPPLKMAWIERGNPVTQNPDTNSVIRALRKLDFVVVVDQFITDTAQEANMLLPAKNMFEQTDIIGSYWNPYVQLKPKVVEPIGDVKTELEIYYELANRLAIDKDDIEAHLIKPDEESIQNYLKANIKKFENLNYEELKTKPIIAPGHEEIAFENKVFKTPSGKIELYSHQAEKNWGVNPLPDFVRTVEGDHELRFNVKYPFYLLTPNTKNRIHSQFGNLNVIKMLAGEPTVIMNPVDGNLKGLIEGEKVKIYNDRGEVKLNVHFDYSLKRGCVSIFNGLWMHEGGSVNLLSAPRETDMGHGSAFHDCMVNVKRIDNQ